MSHVIICNIIIFYTEGDCLISKFDEVYEIMKESFPVDEFREYKEQKKLFEAMTFGKKIEYLWMYYKAWLAGFR